MRHRIALPLCFAVLVLAGCSGVPLAPVTPVAAGTGLSSSAAGDSGAVTLNAYKRELADHIAQANAAQMFAGQPQALLRSVVVIKYFVDADGRLMRSNILRSNRDRATEMTALAALRKAAPFPRPARQLLRQGQVEVLETWLFNNDGRFQLRTIALPQMGE